MLYLTLLAFSCACANARNFNITDLVVPRIVPPHQDEVEIECRYDANFTLLNWFKGPSEFFRREEVTVQVKNIPRIVPPHQDEVEIECRYGVYFTLLNWFKGPSEFFRYRPGSAPSTRTFPILGVGKVEMVNCGPTACRLKLGSLTEDATGLYRCDIERDVPPYKFEARSAFMQVHGHEIRRPMLEGLAEEFADGDEMLAYCRGARDSEIRWYINSREMEDMRGTPTFKRNASRLIFMGVPPTVTLQCAEFRYGKLSGSKEARARWRTGSEREDTPLEQRNSAGSLKNQALKVIYLYFISCFTNFM